MPIEDPLARAQAVDKPNGCPRPSRRGPHTSIVIWAWSDGRELVDVCVSAVGNTPNVRPGEILRRRWEDDTGSGEIALASPSPGLACSAPAAADMERRPANRCAASGSHSGRDHDPELRRWSPGHGPKSEGATAVTSFVAGMHGRPALTEHDGCEHDIQVDLTPLGAHRLFGVPMCEMLDLVVPLEDVLGRHGEELTARVSDATD
jgi:hypothetical protein